MSNYNIQTVEFHGQNIQTFLHNNEPHIVMKSIVEGMGLDWSYQRKKLSGNKARWGVAIIAIPTKGDIQNALCMPLRKLFGWLMTIQPTRLKKDIQQVVIKYQNECDDVLFKYWSGKSQPKQPKLESPYIEGKQLNHIKQGVKHIVDTTEALYQTVYSNLNRTFGAPSVTQIEKQYYEAVCAYLGIPTDFTVPADKMTQQLIALKNDSQIKGLALMVKAGMAKTVQDRKMAIAESHIKCALAEIEEAKQYSGTIYDGIYEAKHQLNFSNEAIKIATERAKKAFVRKFPLLDDKTKHVLEIGE